MKGLHLHIAILFLLVLLSSCSGKRYNMLHEVEETEGDVTLIDNAVPTLKSGQELCITVTALNEESAQYFRTSREREGATGIECLYYKIRSNGAIEMPLLGEVILQGLTIEDAELRIKEQLQNYIKEPTVRIEYTDYHISVVGDVEIPGVFQFNQGKVSLLEAISRSGGFSQHGRKDNVLIIRENGANLKHIRVDLTKSDLWESEYYYLNANDVVVVSSNTGRITNSKNLTAWGSILVGMGTVAAIFLTR